LLLEALEDRLTPAPITTIAGTSSYGYNGDGGPATSALLYLPFGTAVDSNDNVFIADSYNSRIREVVRATGNIITVAGTSSFGYSGDGGPATSATLYHPDGVAVDGSGNLFIADSYNNRIREVVKATGNIITIAGNGYTGYSGDGGPATSAMLNDPFGVAVDGSGNVFFSDQGNNRVREVLKATGQIITIAGTGTASYNGDNIPATSAMLNQPNGVAVDGSGNVFISDWHNSRIREVVKATGNIVTFAGTGSAGFSGDGGPATSARVNYPGGVGVDASGNVFIADSSNERIREVAIATGVITTVAGSGTTGFGGDGGPATLAAMNLPYAVAADGHDNLFIADSNNNRVREIVVWNNPIIGAFSVLAWTVNQPGYSSSASIIGGTAPYSNLSATGLPPGVTAALSGSTITLSGTPTSTGTYGNVTVGIQDASGNTATSTFSITINAQPVLGTLAPTQWTAEVSGYTGAIPVSGGTAPLTVVSQANLPPGLSATISGTNVVFTGIPTTAGSYSNVQLTVQDAAGAAIGGTFSITINAPAPGSILTVAGTGTAGYSGDGGAANLAMLYQPRAVAVDASGNVFIADTVNSRVREIVKATGNIVTVAGTGYSAYSGDGGPATSARIFDPTGLAIDASGNIFIADFANYRIREVVKATGNIITVAGNGSTTDSGDGGLATSAGLASPASVAVDASGNLFIAEYSSRVREVIAGTGTIVTVAGTGMPGYSGDNGPATAAMLNSPYGVAVDAHGNLFIADSNNDRIREVVQATGNIITIAGTGAAGYSGDGGPATAAKLFAPDGLTVDASGNVFIADTYNFRVRAILQSSGNIVTVAGNGTLGYSGDGSQATSANLSHAYGLAVDGSGNLFIADLDNNAVREVLPIPAPVLGSLSTTQWTVNQGGYYGSIPVTGAAPPSGSFLTTSGMPPGLTASANVTSAGYINGIVITGTPTAVGTYSATITIRGMSGAPLASRTYTITINAPPALGALSPTQWVAEVSYSGTIPISGGTPGLILVSQANLPPGLTATVRGSNIVITGIPTTTGTYSNVQLTVRDAAGASASGTFSITLNAPAPGSILTFAGNGIPGPSGDGGAANLAGLYYPSGVAVDGNGNVFVADSYDNRIREIVKATGNIITVAGTGAPVYGGDGGPATSASLYHPTGVAVDASGNIFIADLDDNRVREVVAATGNIITVAGNGNATEGGDGGPATSAGLNGPEGVAVDANGNLFIADASGNRVREVIAATGTIITVAGTGSYGYSGDNSPATAAMLYEPTAVAVDGSGNLFIADTYNDRIREVVQATGNIITIAGTGSAGYSGDGGPAASARLNLPFGVNVDGSGDVFIGDTYNNRIREILQYSGNIVTVAGTGSGGYSGDGGPAPAARLYGPNGVAMDGSGNLFIGDTDNNVVREVLASPVLGALSSTAWTVNQAGFSAAIPITVVAPPSGSVLSATGLPAGLSASLSGMTITVSGTPTATGTSNNIVISILSATGSTLASRTYTITINAAPALGTLAPTQWTVGQTGYPGTIPTSGGTGTLTLSSQVNLPAGLTAVMSGTLVTFTGTPTAVGTYGNIQLTVQDTTGATATASYSITINPAPALGALSATVWTVNETGFSSTVSILGGTAPYGNLTATGLPPGLSATLSGSTITLSGTPTTAGTYNNIQLSVQDSALATAGAAYSITITGPAVALGLSSYPTAMTAGTSGSLTVAALDSSGNVVVGYRGTVTLSSSDPAAVLPASYTFSAADAGVHTFAFTLKTAGSQQLAASDAAGLYGLSESIAVSPAALDHFAVVAPQYSASYYAFNVTISAKDAYNNTITGYNGTVHFTSSDSAATLLADYIFTSGDQGTHTFSVTLQTTGNQTVTATDTGTGAAGTATIQDLDYVPGLHFVFNTPSTITAGVPFDVTLTALDEYNAVATHYDGTVALSSNDPGAGAVLPANYTYTAADAGVHTFAGGFTLVTAGTWYVEAVDISTLASGGYGDSKSANITVVPAALNNLALTGFPTTVTAGAAKTFTVAGVDAYGNVVTSYNGTIHFSSTDAQAALPSDTALSNGTGSFSAVLKTAGTQSITATDTASSALTVTQGVTVTPASTAQFAVTGFPTPATAGTGGTFTVTALDAYGNVATGYAGTVHFTSSDAQAVLPADASLGHGTGSFSATLKTAGTQSITATDTTNSSLNGTQNAIPVISAAASSLVLSGFPSSITAGVAASFTVTARDPYGNIASAYTGTVHFTSGDPQATVPADYTFSAADQGVHTFSATLRTAGSQSLAVADTAGGVTSGSEGGISVSAAAAAALVGTAPAGATAGSAFSFTIRALDAFGNQATGYTGTVHFSSSDPHAALPADYTFTAADGGKHVFSATLTTAGSQTLTVSDTGSAGVSGTQLNISIAPAATSAFSLSGFPATVTAGAGASLTVTAIDAYGNVTTGYTGTVHFSSSDSQAVLPANYTFTAADAGTHSFSATLKTAGSQSLSVQDTVQSSISGIHWSTVTPAAASWIAAYYPSTTTAGTAQNLTVYAYDPYGNVATGYTGTVHVTSSDAQATLPADYTFTAADAGVHTLSVTLKTAGVQGITVQDVQNGFTAHVSGITVTAAAASRLTIGGFPSSTTAGASGSLIITAYDAYGNIATGYAGTVHFTSSDAQAGLPADYTFAAGDSGVHTFSATLCTAGTQSLTVTDTVTPTLTASQTGISVVAGAASKLLVSGYPATTAGTSHSFTVTACDAYGNLVTGYRGTVHFSSSDGKASLPGNYTFTAADNGVHTFSATLKTAGSQALTATDTATSSITGTQSGIVVTAAVATHFAITAPATASVGVAFSVTVTALDAYGNVATGYLGTTHFTSNDHKAILPSDYAFVAGDAGVHTFQVTFKTTGTETLTVTDTHTGSIKGSASVKVS
jgi:sugar lactone lactonase YvrE